VVVFMPPPQFGTAPWCFRVVGLPGESIDIGPHGVFINGTNTPLPPHLKNVSYLAAVPGQGAIVSYPFSIPSGSYFVLGDRSTNAYDSRYFGPVPLTSIKGKVLRK